MTRETLGELPTWLATSALPEGEEEDSQIGGDEAELPQSVDLGDGGLIDRLLSHPPRPRKEEKR